jgi:hypothetical protein
MQVKTWTATCTTLFADLARRLSNWQTMSPGDITISIACEEAFPLIRSGCKVSCSAVVNEIHVLTVLA